MRLTFHFVLVAALTVLTQIGGLAWLLALSITRGALARLAVFCLTYAGLTLAVQTVSGTIGSRHAMPCFSQDLAEARMANPLFCALNRNFAEREVIDLANALATHMNDRFPGTETRALDANFPFWDGFPLLPHLSHDDGRKLDLAFWYEGRALRSPIGYWAFEKPRPGETTPCSKPHKLTMRWDVGWFQPFVADAELDEGKLRAALVWLNANLGANGKAFVEPHLAERVGATGSAIRFQGCRAARHDDHIHIQL